MTNAEGDIIRYWRRKCDICKETNLEIYNRCNESTYHCTRQDIDVYK